MLAGASGAFAYKLPIVTGKDWTASKQDQKLAFLLGAATIIKIEHEVQGAAPPNEKTLVDTWIKGLSPFTLTTLVQKLDAYYKANPDKLDRPVIAVMWTEIALPAVYKD